MHMKPFFKFIALIITTIGLLIGLADVVGWIPNPRAQLGYKIISLGNNILPLKTVNIDDLLRYFLKKKYPDYIKRAPEWVGIAIEDIRMGASVMGTVYLEHKNGKRYQLCSFQQLHEWVDNEKLPFWIGWWLAVAGLACSWILAILETKKD